MASVDEKPFLLSSPKLGFVAASLVRLRSRTYRHTSEGRRDTVSYRMVTHVFNLEFPFAEDSPVLGRRIRIHWAQAVSSVRFRSRTWMVAQSLSFPSALARYWLISFSRVAWLSESTDMLVAPTRSERRPSTSGAEEALRWAALGLCVGLLRLSSTNTSANVSDRSTPDWLETTHTRRGSLLGLRLLPRRSSFGPAPDGRPFRKGPIRPIGPDSSFQTPLSRRDGPPLRTGRIGVIGSDPIRCIPEVGLTASPRRRDPFGSSIGCRRYETRPWCENGCVDSTRGTEPSTASRCEARSIERGRRQGGEGQGRRWSAGW